MAEAWHLSVAFLDSHPPEGARVLESLSTAEASALLASLPERIAAKALAAMLPPAAARLLCALDDASAHALLQQASTQAAVAILRHVPEPSRVRLLAGLPPASALASQLLLGLPDDTVGAWTDPDVLAASPNESVDAARSRARGERDSEQQHVYVIDAERHLLGSVTMETLVRAASTDLLVRLMRPAATTLSAMMPVSSARELVAWERSIALPVVDHDKRLIGVLRRSVLTQALRARARPATESAGNGSVAGALAAGYWRIVSTLSGATTALLPGVKRVLPDE